jgi:SAM-dependent methyltransferase
MNNSFDKDITWDRDRYMQGVERLRFEAACAAVPPQVSTLLDVGAGNGAFLHYLEERFPRLVLQGVEYSQGGIRNRCCRSPIADGSIDRLPHEDASFDLVSCLEVIEHLPVDVYRNGLSELQRVAKRHILISVPFRENRVNVVCPMCGCAFHPDMHVRSFREADMQRLFSSFELVKLQTVGTKREMYFGRHRRLARQLFGGKYFPARCVCPQCHYTAGGGTPSSDTKEVSAEPRRNKWIKRMFFYDAPRWYMSLYTRT